MTQGTLSPHIQRLLAQPGLWHSAALSFWIAAASTLGSLLLTALLLAHSVKNGEESRSFRLLRRLLSPAGAAPRRLCHRFCLPARPLRLVVAARLPLLDRF